MTPSTAVKPPSSAAGGVLGAFVEAEGTRFSVWAPKAGRVAVRFFRVEGGKPVATDNAALAFLGDGLFEAHVAGIAAGALYKFELDGAAWPDPYARFLPFGVHGPAEVIARTLAATDFRPPTLEALSIYELHIGTFTAEGTYAAAATQLAEIAALGVTAIELLPLAAFPGSRGWGYDGVAGFAPYAPYGRPEELRRFVDVAHGLGLAVFLDVVYNHFGPSGNYLSLYAGEYFGSHDNPWGQGPDFSHPRMRSYALASARLWFEEYGFDGLRLDATHAIHDPSPRHILADLAKLARSLSPPRRLIAEDDRNEPALVTELGLDAVWADDFHHQVEVLLTGEQDGYYGSYPPSVAALAQTIANGWTFEGQVFPFSGKPRGKPATGLAPAHLVYCLQNHDQVGNRALGTRLHHDAPLDGVEAATALLLFLPAIPILFMGQEWAASAPFQFFTDHDAQQGPLVSKGRIAEFAKFAAFAHPEALAKVPDPQAASTFERSKLDWDERALDSHRRMLALTMRLLSLRREDPVLRAPCAREQLSAREEDGLLVVERRAAAGRRTLIVNFGSVAVTRDWRAFGTPILATRPLGERLVEPRSAALFEA